MVMQKADSLRVKGLAIALVCISHIGQFIEVGGVSSNVFLKLLHPLGFLGVGLFLTASGYGTMIGWMERHSGWNLFAFLKKRCAKIVPELMAITILSAVLAMLLLRKRYTMPQVVLNSIGVHSDLARFTWYILFQYIWYVIFGIGTFVKRKYWKLYYGSLTIILFFVSTWSGISEGSMEQNCLASMWGMNLLNFPLGVYFAGSANNKVRTTKKALWYYSIFATLFVLNYVVLNNLGTPFAFQVIRSNIAAAFSAAIFYSPILCGNSCTLKWFQAIGKGSYEIYLVHGFLLFVFSELLLDTNIIVSVMQYILLTIFFSAIIYHINTALRMKMRK